MTSTSPPNLILPSSMVITPRSSTTSTTPTVIIVHSSMVINPSMIIIPNMIITPSSTVITPSRRSSRTTTRILSTATNFLPPRLRRPRTRPSCPCAGDTTRGARGTARTWASDFSLIFISLLVSLLPGSSFFYPFLYLPSLRAHFPPSSRICMHDASETLTGFCWMFSRARGLDVPRYRTYPLLPPSLTPLPSPLPTRVCVPGIWAHLSNCAITYYESIFDVDVLLTFSVGNNAALGLLCFLGPQSIHRK